MLPMACRRAMIIRKGQRRLLYFLAAGGRGRSARKKVARKAFFGEMALLK